MPASTISEKGGHEFKSREGYMGGFRERKSQGKH